MPVTGTPSGAASAWPIYVDHMPETPDNALCVYDTSGVNDGRIMKTGEAINHPGFQVKVRGTDFQTAMAKAKEIVTYINQVLRKQVTIGSNDYEVCAVRQTGTIISLGQETDAKRRSILTINGTITIKEI